MATAKNTNNPVAARSPCDRMNAHFGTPLATSSDR